mmetsp:Transcript_74493/g.212392  ORF Transcript_74493/g.212392 Transcript_74493/m.212392 type:complete len:275 (-) Transcript_74493:46-870(-)
MGRRWPMALTATPAAPSRPSDHTHARIKPQLRVESGALLLHELLELVVQVRPQPTAQPVQRRHLGARLDHLESGHGPDLVVLRRVRELVAIYHKEDAASVLPRQLDVKRLDLLARAAPLRGKHGDDGLPLLLGRGHRCLELLVIVRLPHRSRLDPPLPHSVGVGAGVGGRGRRGALRLLALGRRPLVPAAGLGVVGLWELAHTTRAARVVGSALLHGLSLLLRASEPLIQRRESFQKPLPDRLEEEDEAIEGLVRDAHGPDADRAVAEVNHGPL